MALDEGAQLPFVLVDAASAAERTQVGVRRFGQARALFVEIRAQRVVRGRILLQLEVTLREPEIDQRAILGWRERLEQIEPPARVGVASRPVQPLGAAEVERIRLTARRDAGRDQPRRARLRRRWPLA